ncbi:MAG: phospholipid-binding protein MlaC [Balneolaceae bacterium]
MNKYLKQSVILLQVIFFVSGGLFAQSQQDEIKTLLESRDQEIKEILGPEGDDYTQEQRNRLKDIINGIIDFESMASYALGETFNEISEDERVEFVSLFSTIIRDNSLNRLDIYRADVSYEEINITNGKAKVRTIAQLENVRTPVFYDLRLEDGEWVITDMIIDDVSTAESYNRQFQSIIRKRGYEALKSSLERRAARASEAS